MLSDANALIASLPALQLECDWVGFILNAVSNPGNEASSTWRMPVERSPSHRQELIEPARVRVGMEQTFTKPPGGPSVVARNIEALLQRQGREQQSRTLQQRIADAITAAAGSLPFVYVHLAVVILWVLVNVGWTPLNPFDPTFVLLATAASVEAIFLSTFVLVTQNRMQREADRRADLDLQISLLTEHELTRAIQLVNAIATKVGVAVPIPELDELQRDVSPEQVMDAIDDASTKGSAR